MSRLFRTSPVLHCTHGTTKKTVVRVLFVVLSLSLLATSIIPIRGGERAHAASNNTLNFQARILQTNGAVVPDGSYNVRFKIYSGGTSGGPGGIGAANAGSLLWTETWQNSNSQGIDTKNGYISAALGSITAFSGINWDQELWITMDIGGTSAGASPTYDGEMLQTGNKRMKVTGVPYAIAAGRLQTTDAAGTNTSSLSIAAPTGGSQVFQLQDQTAAGTYNLALLNGNGTQTFTGLNTFSAAGTALTVTNNASIGGTLGVTGLTTATGGLTTGTGSTLTVGGATLNNTLAIGNLNYTGTGNTGSIGSAASTVDIYTNITIAQTTAGQTLTIPAPTTSTSGRVIYITNIGSAGYTMAGAVVSPGVTMQFVWNNTTSSWSLVTSGVSGSYIQNGTAVQTANFNIQSNSTTDVSAIVQGANSQSADILQVKAASISSPLFSVSATGNTTVQPSVDSSTAFVVKNAAGSTSLFVADTSTGTVSVNGKFITSGDQVNINSAGAGNTYIGNTGYATQLTGGVTLTTSGSANFIDITDGTNNYFRFNGPNSSVSVGNSAVATSATNINAGSTGLINLNQSTTISGDLTFVVGATRTISVANQTVNNTAGNGLVVRSAAGLGSGSGGQLNVVAGDGGATGAGGAVFVTAGSSGSSGTAAGGQLNLAGGASFNGTGAGGAVNIVGGGNSTTGSGGNINITGGGTDTGAGGSVYLDPGQAGSAFNPGNIYIGTMSGGGTINIGNTSDSMGVNILNAGTLNIGTGNVGSTVNLGTGNGLKAVTIGSTNTTSGTTILAGSGNINLNAATIATNQTSINLLNTTATTVNAFGAATALNIGAGSGTTTINNGLTVSGATLLNGNSTIGNASTDRLTVTSQILGGSPLVFQGATDDGFTTTFDVTDPTANNTIIFPNASGTVLLAATGSGNAIVQVPTAAGVNVITPTAASVIGLTVNGTIGTAATALAVSQPGAAAGVTIASANNTATNGLSFSGTFTNLINATNFSVTNAGAITAASTYNTNTFTGSALSFGSAATATVQSAASQALNITGHANSVFSTDAGTLTLQGVTGTTLTTAAGGTSTNVTIKSGDASAGVSGNVEIDTGTHTSGSPSVKIGTNAQTSAVFVGNTTGTNTTTINGGVNGTTPTISLQAATSGYIAVGTANANTIQIGAVGASAFTSTVTIGTSTGAAQNVTIGSNANFNSATIIQGGNSNTAGSEAIRLVPQLTGGIAIGSSGASTGTITLGQSTASNTINIGNAVGVGNTQTIGIGTSTTGTTNVTIGSTAAGTITLQSASSINVNAPTVVGNATTQNLFNTVATTVNAFGAGIAINIGATTAGGTTTINSGNVILGNTTNRGTVVNYGGTFMSTLTVNDDSNGGALGGTPAGGLTAAQSVDIYTSIGIGQTTANQAITLPSPSTATIGRVLYVTNTGTTSFTINGTTFTTGSTATMFWTGSAWTFAGMDGGSSNYIQNQTAAEQAASFKIGGTGTVSTTNATAFRVQSASAADVMFTVDSSAANQVKVGNNTGTGASTTVFVLDTATTAPTANGAGVNGSMYYDSTKGHVQCYENGVWGDCGNTTLQNAYTNSTGGTTPEILVDSTRNGVDIQDANTTLGSSVALLAVRGSATASTLGASLFQVNNNAGTGMIGINLGTQAASTGIDMQFGGSANRTIQVLQNTTANLGGNSLTVQAGAANTAGNGGATYINGGTGIGTGATYSTGTIAQTGTAITGTGTTWTTGMTGGTIIYSDGTSGIFTRTGNTTGTSSVSKSVTAGASYTIRYQDGGSVFISGGTSTGGGAQGLVNLSSTTFVAASATQSFAADGSLSSVDNFSTIVASASNANLTITVPAPSIAVVGRIIYVSAANGSNDFALSLAGTSVQIAMKANSTATLIWNGTGWTAAGASSSTTLQAAYDNTLVSAGGAEILLNSSTAGGDGLTIRNNTGAKTITGALLEVQTSVGSNLFSVNNNATEYANNGGAETTTFTMWPTAPNGGTTATITRDTTVFATGIASTKVVTTGATTANQGVANTLTAALTANLQYTVSFTVKGTTSFKTLDVVYSKDGTNTATTTCSTANTVTVSGWTRVGCTFTAPASGITSSNAIFIRQSNSNSVAATYYVDNLSVTVNASVNHAVDGSVDSALGTNWVAIGGSVARDTSVIYDTSGSVAATTGSAGRGVYNNLANGITPAINTQYRVSFYARGDGTNAATIAVNYSRDGGTTLTACQDYNTQTAVAATFTLITCYFTTDGTTPTAAQLRITQTGATPATFYVDGLNVTLNNNNASNVQIGGGSKGGPTTLLTLDRSSTAPIAANNDAYLGSMYYDTSTGRIQCYEADGWGACGSAPDNIVNLNPEYAGAVLNGGGVGTMTADLCANSGALSVNSTLCAAGQSLNYYRWTSPQATQQTYSIYVNYQLPSTFKSFASDNTVQLTGRVDNTTNAAVTYQMYVSHAGSITQCGTGETNVITTPAGGAGSANNWYTYGINGNESTGCPASGGDYIIFKINLKANSSANAYVSTLSFTTTGK